MSDYLSNTPGLLVDRNHPFKREGDFPALSIVYPATFRGEDVVVKQASDSDTALETLQNEIDFLLSPESRQQLTLSQAELFPGAPIKNLQVTIGLIKPTDGANTKLTREQGMLVLPLLKGERLISNEGVFNPRLSPMIHLAVWAAWGKLLESLMKTTGYVVEGQPHDFDVTVNRGPDGKETIHVVKFDCGPIDGAESYYGNLNKMGKPMTWESWIVDQNIEYIAEWMLDDEFNITRQKRGRWIHGEIGLNTTLPQLNDVIQSMCNSKYLDWGQMD